MIEQLLIKQVDKNEKTCKGLVFRGVKSTYLSSHRSFETRISLRLLKKKSCPGCPKCEWMWEEITEILNEFWNGGDFLKDVEDGKMYNVRVGYNCDTYLEVTEYKE